MQTIDQTLNPNFWQRNKIIFKGFLIGFLVLLLLIPASMIQNLIQERQSRQQEAVKEINAKWASDQVVYGPVITVPYNHSLTTTQGKHQIIRKFAYFLPSILNIDADIIPETRSRGMYNVVVYHSKITLNGSFGAFKPELLNINPGDMLWDDATINFKVNDVRGLNEAVHFNWDNQQIELIPGNATIGNEGVFLSNKFTLTDLIRNDGGSFNLSINLKGSENLMFVPVGKQTSVKVSSSWPDPKFTGAFLPELRKVTDTGFQASWKVLYLNRNYPQQWKDNSFDLNASAFGLDLLIPVDAYQKSMRSVKYAILCIILTFMAFLLIELIYDKNVHPFQYILVGFALCIFYTLLISISEYIDFGIAYLLAAIATISLISVYVRTLFTSGKMAIFISFLLTAMYGFIYILIQSKDYTLLMGSIGLFIVLALVMYFSKKARLN